MPKRINTNKLKSGDTGQILTGEIEKHANGIHNSEDIEESWSSFRQTIYTTCKETLGYQQKRHREWFNENDEEIVTLLEDNYRLYKAYLCSNTLSQRNLHSH